MHLDDFWVCGREEHSGVLTERIKIGKVEKGGFRYIGIGIKQEEGKNEISKLKRFREERVLIP